jgi:hypothetical protein
MSRVRFNVNGDDIKTYTCHGWYEYGINKLCINIDEFPIIFPNKKFITMNDVIEYVVHVDPGMCTLLSTMMYNLKSVLGEIERKIRNGKITTATIIPALNSTTIDIVLDNIHNAKHLNVFVNLIKEDLYNAYFVDTIPDIYQETPMPPTFVTDLNIACKIDNKKEIKTMLTKCIEYLNTLEGYHFDLIKLIHNTNKSLEKILYV